MKAREFITEATWQDQVKPAMKADKQIESPEKVAQFFEYVKQNCGPFLKSIGGIKNLNSYILYHGTFTKLNPAVILKVRKDREPVDTPLETQELIDDWFERASGIRFRESSIFAVGKHGSAIAYGNVAALMPIGNFNYAWSPIYDDLTGKLEAFLERKMTKRQVDYDDDDTIISGGAGMFFVRSDVTNPEYINEFMNRGDFRINHGMIDAIQSHKEIMLDCDRVIVVSDNWLDRISEQ